MAYGDVQVWQVDHGTAVTSAGQVWDGASDEEVYLVTDTNAVFTPRGVFVTSKVFDALKEAVKP